MEDYFLVIAAVVRADGLVDAVIRRSPMFCGGVKTLGKAASIYPPSAGHCLDFLIGVLPPDRRGTLFKDGHFSLFISGWAHFNFSRTAGLAQAKRLLDFVSCTAVAALFKSEFLTGAFTAGFGLEAFEVSLDLRRDLLAHLDRDPALVGILTAVLWEHSVFRRCADQKCAEYLPLKWQLLAREPATADFFRAWATTRT
jgi:hypothetical protein